MFWVFVKFSVSLWHHYLIGQHFRQDIIVDSNHSHYRRLNTHYKKKQSVAKNFWIGAGLITMIFPIPQVASVVSILATFASFCILDESGNTEKVDKR